MFKGSKSLNFVLFLLFTSPVFLGVKSCAEPKEYCQNAYEIRGDQLECSTYCEAHKDFESSDRLIKACQNGQMIFLLSERDSASKAELACDRNYQDALELAKACRTGVNGEALRTSKTKKSPGTATDRENGR